MRSWCNTIVYGYTCSTEINWCSFGNFKFEKKGRSSSFDFLYFLLLLKLEIVKEIVEEVDLLFVNKSTSSVIISERSWNCESCVRV